MRHSAVRSGKELSIVSKKPHNKRPHKKKSKKEDDYTAYLRKPVEEKRKHNNKNYIYIALIVIFQIAVVCCAVFYNPKPLDCIDNYNVTVTPNKNGSLDIEYSFVWTPIDENEDLTWVSIGMANNNFEIVESSRSANIKAFTYEYDDYGFIGVNIYFVKPYKAGETFEFSFKTHQEKMLCSDGSKMFYEFVPCWFNSTPIKSYTFRWLDKGISSSNNDSWQDGYRIWKGSLDCGEYVSMNVNYAPDHFKNADVVSYEEFCGSVYNELKETKILTVVICIALFIAGIVGETVIFDSLISYNKGRGFLTGYGVPMHTYGYVNPRYIVARDKHHAHSSHSSHHFGGGGGCACACACAGGGRAGCSQKDTYKNTN